MPNETPAAGLEHALALAGIPLVVEGMDRLALLQSVTDVRVVLDADARRRVQELARQHGFTHAALEILTPAVPPCDSSSP